MSDPTFRTHLWGLLPRREKSRTESRRIRYARAIVAVVLWVVALLQIGPAAPAASVFMKNGYIIQGPVIERDEGNIVMGWPNGKVTLARRFIDSVTYDPGEEKRLNDEEKIRKTDGPEETSNADLLVSVNETMELPSTLEELMRTYNIQGRDTPAGAAEPVAAAAAAPPVSHDAGSPGAPGREPPPVGSGTGVPVTVLVKPADDKLGEKITDAPRGITLRAPKGWRVRSDDSAFVLSGPYASGVFGANMNCVVFSKGPLGPDDYVTLLKQENSSSLTDYEPIREGFRELGSRRAFEVFGRASHKGNTAFVRQLLAVEGDKVWLISAFTPDQDSENGTLALTEAALKTLEFTAP